MNTASSCCIPTVHTVETSSLFIGRATTENNKPAIQFRISFGVKEYSVLFSLIRAKNLGVLRVGFGTTYANQIGMSNAMRLDDELVLAFIREKMVHPITGLPFRPDGRVRIRSEDYLHAINLLYPGAFPKDILQEGKDI